MADIIAAASRFADDRPGRDEHGIFLCECTRLSCRERMRIRNAEYQAVAAHPARFLVVPEHVDRTAEHVVELHPAYSVVQVRAVHTHLWVVPSPEV